PSHKRPASASPILEDDVDDDDDDVPLIVKRKVIKLVYSQAYVSILETFLCADDLFELLRKVQPLLQRLWC
ncbi:hypothetical protein, partial [Staphylococcus nepalensis]|uniref:hypothetical protein n=1 Tax=Staphylococcus nepalensis TaxID=214473 RepID=UPI00285F8288